MHSYIVKAAISRTIKPNRIATHYPPLPPPATTRTRSHARDGKVREIRPVAQAGRVAPDADVLRIRRVAVVDDEQLEPARRADLVVRRRGDGARGAGAGERREDGALAHAVAVGAADGAHERDLHRGRRALVQRDRDLDALAVCPVRVDDGVGGRGQAGHAVGRDEDLDAVLLRVDAVLGVGARDHDAAVGHEDRFRVVQARDRRVGHDAHALVDGRGGVVQDGVEVGPVGQAEACHAVRGPVEDEVRSVREGGDARHDALRRHALQRPHRVRDLGLRRDAVVDRRRGAGGGAAADQDGDGRGVGRILGHDDGGAFEGVVAAGEEVVDRAGDVGQLGDGVEVDGFEESGLVVVPDEDVA